MLEKQIRVFIAIFMVQIFVLWGYAQETNRWHEIGTMGDGVRVYITKVGKVNSEIKSFWIKYVEKDGVYKQNFYNINCNKSLIAVLASASYSSLGELIESNDFKEKWEPIIPESAGEVFEDNVCLEISPEEFLKNRKDVKPRRISSSKKKK